ncbi:MAG: tyrosine-type recombinase/integrase [Tenericutes bacterium]|nr:tyrosine-type recombinase/integrase [Mycoplasmatota bacterium]
MKLNQAIEEFRDYTAVTKSKGTTNFYKYYLKILSKELGLYDCINIDNKVILSYIKKRQDINPDVSKATLNKHIITLKAVVKYATGRKIEFRKLKEQKKLIETVPKETSTKIFNYYQKHLKNSSSFRNYLFLRLLLDTGLRLHEMINIRLNNIDFNTSSIHVTVTKTDLDRIVCYTELTKVLMISFIATHKITDYLFYDFETRNKMTTSSVESFIYRIKKKLDIKDNITPHKWRHTFATNFLRNGGDLETLRIILGHTNLKTTQKYLHLSKNDIFKQYKSVMDNKYM